MRARPLRAAMRSGAPTGVLQGEASFDEKRRKPLTARRAQMPTPPPCPEVSLEVGVRARPVEVVCDQQDLQRATAAYQTAEPCHRPAVRHEAGPSSR
jgi:hypothetical protein